MKEFMNAENDLDHVKEEAVKGQVNSTSRDEVVHIS